MEKKRKVIQGAKERMRKYRERIKQDPQKYEEMKQKDKARWKKRVNENKIKTAASKMTERERRALRKQWREKTRKYRAKIKEKKQLQEEKSLPPNPDVQIVDGSETNKPIKLENEIKKTTVKMTEREKRALRERWKEKTRKYRAKIKEKKQLQEKSFPSSPGVQIIDGSETNKPIKLENKIKIAATKMTKRRRKPLRKQWVRKTRKYRAKIKEKKQLQEEKSLPPNPDAQIVHGSKTNKPIKLENEIKRAATKMTKRRRPLQKQWGRKTRKYRAKIKEKKQLQEEKSLPPSPDVQNINGSKTNKSMKFENEIKVVSTEIIEGERRALQKQQREKTRTYRAKMKEKEQLQEENSYPLSPDVQINDSERKKPVRLEDKRKNSGLNKKTLFFKQLKNKIIWLIF